MGLAFRNPGQIVTMPCDSASVVDGAALFQGASNDSVMLPGAANTSAKFIGLAYLAGATSASQPISVVKDGIWAGVAAGTIVRGDRVVAADTSGGVQSESLSTPADASRIGVALESVSSGERVAILVGAQPSASGTVLTFVANGAITANRIVVASTGGKVAMPGGADPTSGVVGVALEAAADAASVRVCVLGYATVTDSGSGVTAGNNLAVAGTTGTGKTAAPSTGVNSMCVGTVLTTTAASGSIPVLVRPFMLQG